jgi:spermidine/putrescine transport system substrate-binding protein
MRSEEVYVAMAWDGAGWKLHSENANLDFIAPKSGALGWIDTFALPAKAKNSLWFTDQIYNQFIASFKRIHP